jgi:hypothetical protein
LTILERKRLKGKLRVKKLADGGVQKRNFLELIETSWKKQSSEKRLFSRKRVKDVRERKK